MFLIARVTSHIPDKGEVTVRYLGLYSNARRGWAEMIRKVHEVDPLLCPKYGGQMRIIAFLTDYAVVDRIIHHLKLTFVAERPPPPHQQELLMAAEEKGKYF